MARVQDTFTLAYVHARPHSEDASGIFYVGKGRLYRAKSLVRRNPHHQNVINKYGKDNILVGTIECSSEKIAFELEVGLIKCLKRMGVNLVNRTNGGDGVRGSHKSDEWRKAHSEFMSGRTAWNKGKTTPNEVRTKISNARKLQIIKPHGELAKIASGKANKSRLWITDGKTNCRIRVPQALPEGWKFGVSRKER